MPLRGAWLEYETDGNDIFWVRVDRTRKVPVTTLLRAIGIATDSQIIDLFGIMTNGGYLQIMMTYFVLLKPWLITIVKSWKVGMQSNEKSIWIF